jgi:hypothetical protein
MSGKRNLEGLKTQMLECIEAAYDKGYKAAKQDVVATGNKSEYERGLNDAEKARKRLVSAVLNGGLSEYELEQIFDLRDCGDVLIEYTISEIIEKIREYDERKHRKESTKDNDDEIHIGDEIYILDNDDNIDDEVYIISKNHRGIVTALLDSGNKANILCASGNYSVVEISQLHKPGGVYDIAGILKG